VPVADQPINTFDTVLSARTAGQSTPELSHCNALST